jgi:hypothetical protein
MRWCQRSQRTLSSSNGRPAGGQMAGRVEALGEFGVGVGRTEFAHDLQCGGGASGASGDRA